MKRPEFVYNIVSRKLEWDQGPRADRRLRDSKIRRATHLWRAKVLKAVAVPQILIKQAAVVSILSVVACQSFVNKAVPESPKLSVQAETPCTAHFPAGPENDFHSHSETWPILHECLVSHSILPEQCTYNYVWVNYDGDDFVDGICHEKFFNYIYSVDVPFENSIHWATLFPMRKISGPEYCKSAGEDSCVRTAKIIAARLDQDIDAEFSAYQSVLLQDRLEWFQSSLNLNYWSRLTRTAISSDAPEGEMLCLVSKFLSKGAQRDILHKFDRYQVYISHGDEPLANCKRDNRER